MKFYHSALFLTFFLTFLACKEEEVIDKCKDGYLSPGEEQIDCGGDCDPCLPEEEIVYSFAKVDDVQWDFNNAYVVFNNDYYYIADYENDTLKIEMQFNFGNGDSLGARPMKPLNNFVKVTDKQAATVDDFDVLGNGSVIFSKLDFGNERISGFFQAKLAQGFNDTIKITGGQFENLTLF